MPTCQLVVTGSVCIIEGIPGRALGIDYSAYEVAGGKPVVPETPGFGLKLVRRRIHTSKCTTPREEERHMLLRIITLSALVLTPRFAIVVTIAEDEKPLDSEF